jgi:hypothetical protein
MTSTLARLESQAGCPLGVQSAVHDSVFGRRVLSVNDQFDVEVHDAEALEEIELLADLIVATSEHDGRVPQERIDEILGVAPGDDVDDAGSRGVETPAEPGDEVSDEARDVDRDQEGVERSGNADEASDQGV